jgi:hypothetical protein
MSFSETRWWQVHALRDDGRSGEAYRYNVSGEIA